MKKPDYQDIYPAFRVKRIWFIWALGVFVNLWAIRFFMLELYLVVWTVLIVDVIIILPAASHLDYVIENRNLRIRRLVYPDILIPYHLIRAVETAILIHFRARDAGPFTKSLGAYRITYLKSNHKYGSIIINVKNREQFMSELALYVDRSVIFVDTAENTVKKKNHNII